MHAQIAGEVAHGITKTKGMLGLVGGNWKDNLIRTMNHESIELELHKKSGRPIGTDRYIEKAKKP